MTCSIEDDSAHGAFMEITPEQFKRVEHCFPAHRGNVSLSNRQIVNALFYLAEHDCKWPDLPKRFGNWNTVYMRVRRWEKTGVLGKMLEQLIRDWTN